MRPVPQRIDNPQIKIIEQFLHIISHNIEISRITRRLSITCETKSRRCDFAMWLINDGDIDIADRQLIRKRCRRDSWRISAVALERVGETLGQRIQDSGSRIGRHRPAACLIKLPKIIETVAMIGMIVRPDDSVDVGNIGVQQLLTQIG